MSIKSILQKIKTFSNSSPNEEKTIFKLVNIEKDQDENYNAVIQLIGKNVIFKMKPEDILADDKKTAQFSKLDVRNLTFFGYLGINKPKYKLLAEKMDHENKMVFACLHKDTKKVAIKTPEQILADKEINSKLDDADKQRVAYLAALEYAQQPGTAPTLSSSCSLEDLQATKPQLSTMMKKLYGDSSANCVFDICQNADPYFNKFVQEVIYDEIWNLPGLSLIEKSMITIATLASIQKQDQLNIHLLGYLNVAKESKKLRLIFSYMNTQEFSHDSLLWFFIQSKAR